MDCGEEKRGTPDMTELCKAALERLCSRHATYLRGRSGGQLSCACQRLKSDSVHWQGGKKVSDGAGAAVGSVAPAAAQAIAASRKVLQSTAAC